MKSDTRTRPTSARSPHPAQARLALLALIGAVAFAFAVGIFSAPVSAESGPPESAKPTGPSYQSGLSPLPHGAEVPLDWMPPGSKESPVPSEEIFPPQTLSIRFNHKKHVKDLNISCLTCHGAAKGSKSSADRLLPDPEKSCDACHDVNHSDLLNVKAGKEENGQCGFCHLGDNPGKDGKVARLVLPSPNLRFPHKNHLDKNIDCAQCHGRIEELELATRDQLPRMAGCFNCHAVTGAAEGGAKGECVTCHVTEPTGKMVVQFNTGALLPPDWLHMAGHTPDWIDRHKTIAANDSKFCASCHTEEDCASCHDGNVRNRRVHPGDWISMHQAAARLDNPRCVSCHNESSFCADCHRRVGITRDGPVANRPAGARFHPPSQEWTSAPRGAQHHAWEAQRNLNTCVACHSERDCASCHATQLAAGAGVNPHPSSFINKCGTAFDRNPRPCYVCHAPSDSKLQACK